MRHENLLKERKSLVGHLKDSYFMLKPTKVLSLLAIMNQNHDIDTFYFVGHSLKFFQTTDFGREQSKLRHWSRNIEC